MHAEAPDGGGGGRLFLAATIRWIDSWKLSSSIRICTALSKRKLPLLQLRLWIAINKGSGRKTVRRIAMLANKQSSKCQIPHQKDIFITLCFVKAQHCVPSLQGQFPFVRHDVKKMFWKAVLQEVMEKRKGQQEGSRADLQVFRPLLYSVSAGGWRNSWCSSDLHSRCWEEEWGIFWAPG